MAAHVNLGKKGCQNTSLFFLRISRKAVDMVKEVARRHCLEVEALDVAEENVLRRARAIHREREKLKIFPTLIAGSGHKIEGEITEKHVESLFSRIADETRKKYL